MKSEALRSFFDAVASDPALQAQCRAVHDLEQLVVLIQAAGFAVSIRELQLWAHDEAFSAPWWPWVAREGDTSADAQNRPSRHEFFAGRPAG